MLMEVLAIIRGAILSHQQLQKCTKCISYTPLQNCTELVWINLFTLGVTNDKELFTRVLLKNHNIANNYRTNVIEVSICC